MKGSEEMKAFLRIIKPGDLLLIVVLLIISFLPFGIFYLQSQSDGDRIAVISLDGENIETVNLSTNPNHDIFNIETASGETNTIAVSDGALRISSATCPDQVCVRTGFIEHAGETIVCLPHRLVIEIKAESEDPPQDVDIISSFIHFH